MPIFTNTAALWGTLIFLGLFAIYIYRRRSRKIVVSSIMFFAKSKSTAEGGQKLYKLQTPLIFFIEFLIFIFFILALANPMALHKGNLIPLTIVLDDSLSMTAGDNFSARNLGLDYLKNNIFNKSYYRITLVVAGVRPKLIGRRDLTVNEAEMLLRNWTCESASSNIMAAVSQGIEMVSDDGLIMVITDHLNEKSISENIKWISFGKARDNISITAANRSANDRTDRCFFEITNFSSKAKVVNAEIVDITKGNILEKINDKIDAKASRRFVIKTKEQSDTIKVSIKNDEISYDNEVVLLPIKYNKLKVDIDVSDKDLYNAIKKAILSSDLAILSQDSPQLFITDKKNTFVESATTQLVITNATQSLVIAKHFASDKEHFLTSDLPFDNAIWVADSNFKQIGKSILMAGKLPLICIDEESSYKNTIYLNYSFNFSTFHQSNFWPVFFYNVQDWTLKHLSGPTEFNYRSGSQIEVIAEKNSYNLEMIKQSKKSEKKDSYVNNGKAVFVAGIPGLYEIKDGEKTYLVSVNLCSYEESDLTEARSNEVIPEIITDNSMSHFDSVKWWFIMIAFVLLALHQWMIYRRRSGYAF